MDTVFVKDVRVNGPAYMSGLKPGDRLLNVNGMEVAGAPYANVVRAIQQTPTTLRLIVVPKDCDILQTVCKQKNYRFQKRFVMHNSHSFRFHFKLLQICVSIFIVWICLAIQRIGSQSRIKSTASNLCKSTRFCIQCESFKYQSRTNDSTPFGNA